MIQSLVSVSTLLLGAAFLLCGVGVLNTLLALRGNLEGFSAGVVGIVLSSYFAGFLLGTWMGPRVLGRIGHIRSFALFSALASCATLAHVLWIDPVVWTILRIVAGVAMVGLYTVIESWLNVVAPKESRGQVFASYMLVNFLALAVGQVLLMQLDVSGFVLFALAAMLISLSLTPIVLTGLQQPPVVPVPRYAATRMLRNAPLGAIGALLSGLATAAVWGMVPLMAQELGYSAESIGRLMVVMILCGGLAQFPVGYIGDRLDRRVVLLVLSAAAAAASVALGLALHLAEGLAPGQPSSEVLIILILGVIGGTGFCVYSTCVALVNDHLHIHDIVPAASTMLLLHGVGAVAGPVLAGFAIEQFGPIGLAGHFLFAWGLLAIYALWRTLVAERPLRQRRGLFWILRTSPVALELLEDDIN